jgi:MFS superfamily sulfate permease-like transporter
LPQLITEHSSWQLNQDGMLSGIGVLILVSQLHVMIDAKPEAHGLANFAAIPNSFQKVFQPTEGSTYHIAALIGILTIIVLTLWDKFKPSSLRLVPGALIAVVIATAIANFLQLPIKYVDVPTNLLEAVNLPQPNGFFRLLHAPLLI